MLKADIVTRVDRCRLADFGISTVQEVVFSVFEKRGLQYRDLYSMLRDRCGREHVSAELDDLLV